MAFCRARGISIAFLLLCGFVVASAQTTQQYSTFIGATNASVDRIAIDAGNNVYAVGEMYGVDLSTKSGAFRRYALLPNPNFSFGIFIAKINNVGTTTVFATYFGGSGRLNGFGQDRPIGIAVDSARNIYVAINAVSTDLPVVNGFQSSAKGGQELYVVKFNPSASSILYSTYLGGSGDDFGTGLALDSQGRIYVTGSTASTDFPVTANAFQRTNRGDYRGVGFLARIDPRLAGSASLSYSTYFTMPWGALGVAVDAASNAYIVTSGEYFMCAPQPGEGCFVPTPGAYNNVPNGENGAVFVAKFDPTGSNLVWNARFGAVNGGTVGLDIKIDSLNRPVVIGFTPGDSSSGFPVTPGAFQSSNPGFRTGFVTKLTSDGSGLAYSTIMGGSDSYTSSIAINAADETLVTGFNNDPSGFPVTSDALYPSPSPNYSGEFIVKLDRNGSAEYSSYVSNFPPPIPGAALAINNNGDMFVAATSVAGLPTTPGAYSSGIGGSYVTRVGQGPVTCVANSSTPDRSMVICSPTANGMTHQSVRFYARAQSQAGVHSVALYADGVLQTTASGDLLDRTLNLPPGAHALKFVGSDSAGTFSKSSTVYVNGNDAAPSHPCTNSTYETVAICMPANNATVHNPFEISASANTNQGYVNSMILYVDGKRFYSGALDFDINVSVPPGTHTFTVNAWTNNGTKFTKSIVLNVKSYF